MSETPVRKIRIDDELWTEVQEAADREHANASVIVRRALVQYVKENQS